jgi:hypothetical protein
MPVLLVRATDEIAHPPTPEYTVKEIAKDLN